MRTTLYRMRGTTLVELMVAVAILSMVITAIMFMVTYALDENRKVVNRTIQEKILQSVAAELRADTSIYQKNFAPAIVDTATVLADANLPYRWNEQISCDNFATPNCCPTCRGAMGYTIRPINGYPSMYMATVRLTHPDLTDGQSIYEFIVVPK